MDLRCPRCSYHVRSGFVLKPIVRAGFFYRSSDRRRIQRFYCFSCLKSFSEASFELCFGQKKRQMNRPIGFHLVSGVSLRRSALILGLNRKTVVRKLLFLGSLAQKHLVKSSLTYPKSLYVEFDDLETFEHTKLKPLSVILAVESQSRRILGFRVSQMPAKGNLAKKSLTKYGKRADHRRYARAQLFNELKPLLATKAVLKSDENPHYQADVKKYFEGLTHEVHKGRRGCITGQGELKKIGFDPLFSLNHTCAMLRANINRLFRKTWCTTKKPIRLSYHIALYAVFHNQELIG